MSATPLQISVVNSLPAQIFQEPTHVNVTLDLEAMAPTVKVSISLRPLQIAIVTYDRH